MKAIYNEVANRYNTTPDEVEKEIAYALSVARKNPSPSAQAFWNNINDTADVKDVIVNIISRLALVV